AAAAPAAAEHARWRRGERAVSGDAAVPRLRPAELANPWGKDRTTPSQIRTDRRARHASTCRGSAPSRTGGPAGAGASSGPTPGDRRPGCATPRSIPSTTPGGGAAAGRGPRRVERRPGGPRRRPARGGIDRALGERPARPAGTFDPVNGPRQRGSSIVERHEGEPQ